MEHTFPLSWLLTAFAVYTALLFFVSWLTSRKADSNSYFLGNKKSPWPIVAYGMIGTSISGVTFISVPGNVMNENFFYMPLVLGFVIGYIVIAKVLLPLYYRMNVTSIYTYLEKRFGFTTYRTGAGVFMVSRVLGAAVRIFMVVLVLHTFLPAGSVPFWIVAGVFMLLIFLYTFKGGVKTIIWTDVLQTTFMLIAVILTVISIVRAMDWNLQDMTRAVAGTDYSSWFNWDWSASNNAVKQFISGIFITIVMTGLDQEMMQKNLSCKNIKSAQKNIYSTSIILVVVNLLFLTLGAVMAIYVNQRLGGMQGIGLADVAGVFSKAQTDKLFPVIASQYLGRGVGLFFIIGLISASYPSAGGALTSLTTSFCIDFLGFDKREDMTQAVKDRIRKLIHAAFAVLFFLIILVLYVVNNQAIINLVYLLAAYTYGPLLGFFFFGIFTKYRVRDRIAPYIALVSPLLCYLTDLAFKTWFDFGLGFTILIVNGLLTFFGMWLFREKQAA
ncbi:MAG: sodium:solute symporter [Bacteroidales bacterium]|jgi:Na+/proline symporter|nr:sodium:solute symporter [Bacteroidales bacterium]MDD2263777.1 sodium:solute symporter [Bacteroidales bacterium]MDD2831005.1 sodium:solute symporter [Bacteroidales bacterium]MDD3208187.1 sodium:solute symporter [Bacteroidales bacterium]MDD3696771.1 sodium:solute symporter [Bacteroidales bacterium]